MIMVDILRVVSMTCLLATPYSRQAAAWLSFIPTMGMDMPAAMRSFHCAAKP